VAEQGDPVERGNLRAELEHFPCLGALVINQDKEGSAATNNECDA